MSEVHVKISIRLTGEEVATVEGAARAAGLLLTDYIKRAALEAAWADREQPRA